MFIPLDFWQPDRDQWKTVLTFVAMVFALVNVGLMRVIWTEAGGFSQSTYSRLSIAHRAFGYGAIAIMLFIAIVTCIGIIGYGGYGTRPTWHSWVAISALALIAIKVYAVRRGLPESEGFQKRAIILSAASAVVLVLLAATVMRDKSAIALPFFPLTALAAFALWRRYGYLPVLGTVFATSIVIVFITSGGWWFINNLDRGPAPDVGSVLAIDTTDIELGRATFASAGCSGCHGDTGFGGIGPSLRSDQFAYRYSDQQLAQRVRGGRGIMPAFSEEQVSDGELAALIRFIRNWYQ